MCRRSSLSSGLSCFGNKEKRASIFARQARNLDSTKCMARGPKVQELVAEASGSGHNDEARHESSLAWPKTLCALSIGAMGAQTQKCLGSVGTCARDWHCHGHTTPLARRVTSVAVSDERRQEGDQVEFLGRTTTRTSRLRDNQQVF